MTRSPLCTLVSGLYRTSTEPHQPATFIKNTEGQNWRVMVHSNMDHNNLIRVIPDVYVGVSHPSLSLPFRFRLFPELHQPLGPHRVPGFSWQVPPQPGVLLHHRRAPQHGCHPHLPHLWPGERPPTWWRRRLQVRLAGGVGRTPGRWACCSPRMVTVFPSRIGGSGCQAGGVTAPLVRTPS